MSSETTEFWMYLRPNLERDFSELKLFECTSNPVWNIWSWHYPRSEFGRKKQLVRTPQILCKKGKHQKKNPDGAKKPGWGKQTLLHKYYVKNKHQKNFRSKWAQQELPFFSLILARLPKIRGKSNSSCYAYFDLKYFFCCWTFLDNNINREWSTRILLPFAQKVSKKTVLGQKFEKKNQQNHKIRQSDSHETTNFVHKSQSVNTTINLQSATDKNFQASGIYRNFFGGGSRLWSDLEHGSKTSTLGGLDKFDTILKWVQKKILNAST